MLRGEMGLGTVVTGDAVCVCATLLWDVRWLYIPDSNMENHSGESIAVVLLLCSTRIT